MKTFKLPIILNWLILLSIHIKSTPKNIGLHDKDLSNTLYKSKRSPNLSYIYISSLFSQIVNSLVKYYLFIQTGYKFNADINNKCLPINKYIGESGIKPHKDRDMISNNAIQKICIITIYQKGKYIFNIYPKATSSNDGKIVDNLNNYASIETKTRQCLLIDNIVHGLSGNGTRYSLTYRLI